MNPPKRPNKASPPVSTADVAAMFKKRFKRGPWPSEADCFRLAIDITAVKCGRPQAAKYADGKFAERLATFNAIRKLTSKQLAWARESSHGLRFPSLVNLEKFAELLDQVRVELLAPYDPLAGERVGSEWHKPVRYIADSVEMAMRAAGYETISKDKRSRFINAVCGALALAGQGEREPSAVAAVLSAPPL